MRYLIALSNPEAYIPARQVSIMKIKSPQIPRKKAPVLSGLR